MRIVSLILSSIILIGILAACGLPLNPVNRDARIQTANIETSIAEATFQAAIFEAAQGTATTIPLPETFTPQPPVEPSALSEEELAALIDANYEDAIYNSLDASEIVQEASSDNEVTEEEIFNTVLYVQQTQASILYAQSLLQQYEDLYGDLATETLDQLAAIEESLNQLAISMTEIEDLLVQGSILASEAISTINELVTKIEEQADEALNTKDTWRNSLQTDLNAREQKFTNFSPNEIASNPEGAISQVYAYLDSIRSALQDHKISSGEMSGIAQLGANAKASLKAQEGLNSQILESSIDGLTRQLSRGEWPQAQNGLANFEASLPRRP